VTGKITAILNIFLPKILKIVSFKKTIEKCVDKDTAKREANIYKENINTCVLDFKAVPSVVV
jgi:hypothetical protein